jgi:ATP-dependent exoDNAse (exonuclease V) beta subunit
MANPIASLAVIDSFDEREIMRLFGRGMDVGEIAHQTGKSKDAVLRVVNRVNLNRGAAREAVRQYDHLMSKPLAQRPVLIPPKAAPDVPAVVVDPETESAEMLEQKDVVDDVLEQIPAAPVDEQTTSVDAVDAESEPAPEPEPTAEEELEPSAYPDAAAIEAALIEASQSTDTRVQHKAAEIWKALADLVALTAISHQERDLLARINDLTRERDEAIEQLKALRQPPAGQSGEGVGLDGLTKQQRSECRLWAKAKQKPYSETGRMPGVTVSEWREAGSPVLAGSAAES